MSLHPDAEALIRAFLDRPLDETPRLVLADWLDDTGLPADAAWAAHIRSAVGASRRPERSPGISREMSAGTPGVRALLTISATMFVRHPRQLLSLLPARNIRVRLADLSVPGEVGETVPESVARENLVMPVLGDGRTLFLAAAQPEYPDLIERLEFMLNKDVVALRGDEADVIAAINRHYGQTETETVDCVSYESPLIGLGGDGDSGALFGVFFTSFSSGMTGFEMELTHEGCRVRYLRGGEFQREELVAPSVYHRLRTLLDSLRPDREFRETKMRCRDLHIPLLSGRPFPVTVECERGWRPRAWFRVRFRW